MPEQDNPVQLDGGERALLAAYRTESKMPPASRDRLLERLESRRPARVATVPPPTNPWIWVGALAAAAIVVVFVARNLESSRAEEAAPREGNQAAMPVVESATGGTAQQRSKASDRDRGASQHEAPVPPPEVPAEPIGEAPADERDIADEGGGPGAQGVRSGRRRGTSRPGPVAEEEPNLPESQAAEPLAGPSPLTEERRLLSSAWRSLARGKPGAATRSAKEHATRFPSGVLAIERDAIATIAACQSDASGANSAADRFLAEHGKTPLARRVRAACGRAKEKSPATDG